MTVEITQCEFCGITTHTRSHHIVPKSKGGTKTVQTCETCESYIHKTWSHNQLRDTYNSVESILSDGKFQKFLKWRKNQDTGILFKSKSGKFRDKNKYH